MHGLDSLCEFMDDFFSQWETIRVEAKSFRACGDEVSVLVRFYGRVQGGTQVDGGIFAVYTVRGGKIVRQRDFATAAEAAAAAGLEDD